MRARGTLLVPFVILLAAVVAGTPLEPVEVFSDDFETGTCLAWSSPPAECSVCDGGATPLPWYRDADSDGWGDPAALLLSCIELDGYVVDDTDCDDTRASVHPGAVEHCDGLDDDCNGSVDDDPVDAVTWYADLDSDGWGDAATIVAACSAPPGYVATTGDCDDGDGAVHPGAEDEPDGVFVDANCDGIDGDLARAVFVAPGGAATGSCPREQPCASIAYASGVAHVDPVRDQVYVQAGTYAGPLTLADAVSVFGGYDTSWVRAGRDEPGHEVILTGGADSVTGRWVTVEAPEVAATLADLVLLGPDAEGTAAGSGRSTQVVHSAYSTLALHRLTLVQGAGAAGPDGGDGTAASSAAAATGAPGADGAVLSLTCNADHPAGGAGGANPSCPGSTSGGTGGAGGSMDTWCTVVGGIPLCGNCTATAGAAGGDPCGSGTGGAGGAVCDGALPQPGESSPSGPDGAGGGGGGADGSLVDDEWLADAGGDGLLGQHGCGGGGGGGAGGCDDNFMYADGRGGGGGGGGAGGCRAPAPGGGGGGGGGSFGVLAVGGAVELVDCDVVLGIAGSGGDGGAGAAGQPGGPGGSGGAATDLTAAGAAGGHGAAGGASGGGGGGAGGRVCGVLAARDAQVSVTGTGFSGAPAPASGGTGGVSPGYGGAEGADGTVENLCTLAP